MCNVSKVGSLKLQVEARTVSRTCLLPVQLLNLTEVSATQHQGEPIHHLGHIIMESREIAATKPPGSEESGTRAMQPVSHQDL